MRKKDYELIATVLNKTMPPHNGEGTETAEYLLWEEIVKEMANALSEEDPRFSREIFFQWCFA